MFVLFAHGMGRTPLSGWPLLRRLRRAGLQTGSFGYVAAFESADAIAARLARRIALQARTGDYVLIGHSLGGVLLRTALSALPPGTRLPRHVYLLGSPIQPSRLAMRLRGHWAFRLFTGDCGQMLGSAARMQALGPMAVPTTGIAGVRGIVGAQRLFEDEANDGVVSLAEVSAPWLAAQVEVPVVHTWLPSSRLVAEIIERDVARHAST